MQITLLIGGKEKTFTQSFVKARILRNAFRLGAKIDENIDTSGRTETEQQDHNLELLDMLAEFVVDVFEGKFTVDDLWDGIALEEFQEKLSAVYSEVTRMRSGEGGNGKAIETR